MRKIEFRAKCIDNGKWVYGYYLAVAGTHKILSFSPDSPSGASYYDVDPKTVGQITGLLDGNKKEIFEGDIVMTYVIFTNEDEEQREFWRVGEIRYIAGGFHLTNCTNYDDHYMECESESQPCLKSKFSFPAYRSEVIGNIYDNPVLIKNSK